MTPQITMGLWGLADLANSLGYEAKIIHTKVEELKNGEFDIKKYIDENVVLVGFSVHWFPMAEESIALTRDIRNAFPDLYVYFGGYSASFFALEIMKNHPEVSAIMQGDGEKPLTVLLECLNNSEKDYSRVPNLVWRDADGQIIVNGISYVSTAEDIKNLHFATMDKYLYEYDVSKDVGYNFEGNKIDIVSFKYDSFFDFRLKDFSIGKTFYLLTGKGCYANCLFCGGGYSVQKKINNRSKCMFVDEDQIIETIKDAKELGYDSFYICFDPVPSKPHYYGLLERIKNENLDIAILFGFWGLPEEKGIAKFTDAAKRLIFEISPETSNEELRNKVRGYSFKNADYIKIVDKCFENKVYTHLYYSYPLPLETPEDVRNDRISAMEMNIKYPHYIEAFYLKLSTDPGSLLYTSPERYGCKLNVSSFDDHLNRCSLKNGSGNICVHSNPLIADDFIEIKRIESDHKMKSLLSYDLKLLGRAFENVEDMICFLDGFYDFISRNEIAASIQNNADILRFLAEYSREDNISAEWLYEMLRLIYMEKELKMLVKIKDFSLSGEMEELHLASNVRVMESFYNVNEVRASLWTDKRFSEVRKREESAGLMMIRTDRLELFELNDSLYSLIKEFETPKTVKEACDNVAAYYTDDTEDRKNISEEMREVAQSLIQQGLIVGFNKDMYGNGT